MNSQKKYKAKSKKIEHGPVIYIFVQTFYLFLHQFINMPAGKNQYIIKNNSFWN